MSSEAAGEPQPPKATGEGLFRLLCALVALSPWVILRGNFDPAQAPQSAVIQVGALTLLLATMVGPARHGRLAVLRTPFDWPLLALLAWSGLSLLWAVNAYEGLTVWLHWLACALVFWIMAAALREEGDARGLLAALFLSGLGVAILGLLQFRFGWTFLPQARPPAATFVHKNLAAAFVAATLPLGPALLLHRPRSKHILGWVSACALMASFVAVTFTRAAWAALLVQTVVMTVVLARDVELRVRWPAPWRAMLVAVGSAALIMAVLVSIALGPDGLRHAYNRLAETWRAFGAHRAALERGEAGVPFTSVQHRRAIWLNTLAMARDAPLFGVGLGNHRVRYPAYAQVAAPDRIFGARSQLDFVHNDYLQALAELGLVGVGLLGWLGFAIARVLAGLWRREPAPRRALVLGTGVAMLGLLVDAAFSFPFQQSIPPLVFMACLGVLAATWTRYGWDTGAWRMLERAGRPRRGAAAGAALAVAVGLFFLAMAHLRWLLSDRHVFRMLQAERRGAWSAALREAEAAHALNPYRREPLLVMAEAHLEAGRSGQAFDPLHRLLRHWPHDMSALGNLGLAHAARGEDALAFDAFERVLRISPLDARALRGEAVVRERQGRLAEAVDLYRRAADAAPDNSDYLHEWGVAALRAGRHDEALLAFRRTLAVRPDRAVTHKALGVLLYEVLGRREEGAQHFRRALELAPADRDAPRMRALLEQSPRGAEAPRK
jgi:tetratricopeptide (TPR) repeat protein/O-antigen ligase